MKVISRDDDPLGTNMRLECSVIKNDNKVNKELKDGFKVAGKGKANDRQECGVDKTSEL